MNFLLQTDSYKLTHWKQYPAGTQRVYSYLESRGGQFDETVFFGLQYIVEKYLAGRVVTQEDIDDAALFCKQHFGSDDIFNRAGWEHIRRDHRGFLPVKIKAVPEGTVVPVGNVLMSIENTCYQCFWLTNFLETMLLQVWYPITVATQSREIKKVILSYLEKTGTPESIDFKLHDFGYRGVSSQESAAIGGAAHLVNFKGSDTLAGIELLRRYYREAMAGFSIPASEHSTITSWGPEREIDAMANMLEQYPTGLVACVSDSFDIYRACSEYWGTKLRSKIMQRDGVLIVRPDSGDPATVVLSCLEILGEKFGTETNAKGYRVLCPKVRVIQGDGVNYHSINGILRTISERGWSADNIAFGMGGALLQQLNRDTQKFAIKCSNVRINGTDFPVCKNPVTDTGKKSKAGRLALVNVGHFSTVPETAGLINPDDCLRIVFLNGDPVLFASDDLATIRQRAAL